MKTLNLSKIIQLIETGSYSKAELEVKGLVERQPNNFVLNKIYGVTLLAQQKYLLSIEAFEKCYKLKADDYDVSLNLSYLFSKIQSYRKSLLYSKYSLNIDEHRPEAYQNIAECYLNLKKYDEAEKYILIAIKKRGGLESEIILKFHDTLILYGDIILAKKEKERFCDFAYKILDKGNFIDQLLITLLRIDINYFKKAYLDKMNDTLRNINSIKPLKSRFLKESNINFILAEFCQNTDKDRSEKYYIRANEIVASLQRGSLFERQKRMIKIIDNFKNHKKLETTKTISSNKGDGLIFIIGMPRSGTTLVESIIATADNCVAGGEKLFFSLVCNKLLSEKNFQEHNNSLFQRLGDQYLDTIDLQRDGKKFFIDKLPENFLYFKYIKNALPGAKFLHIYRDPWDNAISLFKQNYAFNLFYSSTFFGIALEYANYEHIMRCWRESEDQSSFFDIEYEKLVSNTMDVAKKIWDYCNLDGEYEENKRTNFFSLTASKQQVGKDIYQTSIKKNDFETYKPKFYEDLEQQRKFWSDSSYK